MGLTITPKRNGSLEALRGVASVVVLFAHTVISFFPSVYGTFGESDPAFSLKRTPFFALINGQAAVVFFFVLSGFVLTHRYFATHDSDIIWRGMIKRWPRLAAPALIVVLVAWAGFVLNVYWYREASALFKTPWLESFGAGSPELSVVSNFWFALADGAVFSFLRRGSNYNSNLWTMTYELSGSFMIFIFAIAAVKLQWLHISLRAFFVAIAFIVGGSISPLFSAFILGAVLSWVYVVKPIQVSPLIACIGLFIAFYLAGYNPGSRPYDWLTKIGAGIQYGQYVWIFASAIAIVSVAGCHVLAKTLSGRLGRFLGSMSFPIYLVQIVVICSIGSYAYVATVTFLPFPFPGLFACLVCVVGTFLAALPLRSFDLWWVPTISRISSSILDFVYALCKTGIPRTKVKAFVQRI
jgi:peptidoglycan/LPS O-acetylase OafA/YrhL